MAFLRVAGTTCLLLGIAGWALTTTNVLPLEVAGWILLIAGGLGELSFTVAAVVAQIRRKTRDA
jgi:hypothetical protein